MNVIVIHSKDLQDNETSVIGVADSNEQAEKMIDNFYGEHEVESKKDIQDSGLEYSAVLKLFDHMGKPYRVNVWLEWFTVNESM